MIDQTLNSRIVTAVMSLKTDTSLNRGWYLNEMTPRQAEKVLIGHTEPVDGSDERSFLGNLRPYPGELYESNFLEIIEAIRTLAPVYQTKKNINREVAAALWDICWLGTNWGVHPDGMLQRNHLISEKDAKTLEDWIYRISEATSYLLGGGDVESAMGGYQDLADR